MTSDSDTKGATTGHNVEATSRAVGDYPPVVGTPVGYPNYPSAPLYNPAGNYAQYSTPSPVGYEQAAGPAGGYGAQAIPQMYPYGPNVPPQGMYVETVYVPSNLEPMPCLCGVQWTMFMVGWLVPLLWFVAAFLPLCMKRDIRELPGWIANLCMVFTCALLAVIFGILHHYGHYSWSSYHDYYP